MIIINTTFELKYDKTPRKIYNIIYIFILCSFLGWLIEIGYMYLLSNKFIDRGIAYGPICSIYGFGAVILYIVFGNIKKSRKNILFVFIFSTFLLGTFELLSGIFFKYALNIEMWNYDGQFLEILNYTTVPIALSWGLFASLYVFFIQPIFIFLISKIPSKIYIKLALFLVFIYSFDITFSIIKIIRKPEVLEVLVNPNIFK